MDISPIDKLVSATKNYLYEIINENTANKISTELSTKFNTNIQCKFYDDNSKLSIYGIIDDQFVCVSVTC